MSNPYRDPGRQLIEDDLERLPPTRCPCRTSAATRAAYAAIGGWMHTDECLRQQRLRKAVEDGKMTRTMRLSDLQIDLLELAEETPLTELHLRVYALSDRPYATLRSLERVGLLRASGQGFRLAWSLTRAGKRALHARRKGAIK